MIEHIFLNGRPKVVIKEMLNISIYYTPIKYILYLFDLNDANNFMRLSISNILFETERKCFNKKLRKMDEVNHYLLNKFPQCVSVVS